MAENDTAVDEVFKPHASQYTSSGDDSAGRPPSSENTDKQTRDKLRRKANEKKKQIHKYSLSLLW